MFIKYYLLKIKIDLFHYLVKLCNSTLVSHYFIAYFIKIKLCY